MDEISEETYFSIAKKAMINTEQEKKYWIADVENYSHITKILEDLKEKGFYTGTLDGVCGEFTVNAIKLFQSTNNLLCDGVVGQYTWKKLLGV